MESHLTKEQLEIIASAATTEAIRAYEKKHKRVKKEAKKRNLRNTGLLLKNYTKLKDLCNETLQEEIPVDYPEFDLENLTLESLSIYRKKTFKMLNHVDRMLTAYKWNCAKGSIEEQRRFKILKRRYLIENKLSVKELCEEFHIEQGTVYRDTKLAIKDMSVLLFGIEAIDFS